MAIFHGNTIGSGVVIITPSTLGNANEFFVSNGDGTSRWKTAADIGLGTYNDIHEEGVSESAGRKILDFRGTGDATVDVVDDLPGNRTQITINATAGAGAGGIQKGAAFIAQEIMYASSVSGDGTAETIPGVTVAVLTGHLGDATIHFTQAEIDHTNLLNVGTRTHAQIDSHILDTSIHFTDAPSNGTLYGRQDAGWAAAESYLGNPTTDGHVLSSTAAGIRSWIAQGGVDVAADYAWTGNHSWNKRLTLLADQTGQFFIEDTGSLVSPTNDTINLRFYRVDGVGQIIHNLYWDGVSQWVTEIGGKTASLFEVGQEGIGFFTKESALADTGGLLERARMRDEGDLVILDGNSLGVGLAKDDGIADPLVVTNGDLGTTAIAIIHSIRKSSLTNAAVHGCRVSHRTSNTTISDGFGVGYSYGIKDDAGAEVLACDTLAIRAGADDTIDWTVRLSDGGNITERLRIGADGLITLDGQIAATSGAFTLTNAAEFQESAHFGTEIVSTPTGTTQAINLVAANHQKLQTASATGNITVTLNRPPGSASGTIIVEQGTTVRDLTWATDATTLLWLGTEPDWISDDPNSVRIVSWRYDSHADVLYLIATAFALFAAAMFLYPSSSWDGTLSWPGRTPPIDPVRTTFKPAAHFAIPPYQDVTANLVVPVMAFCKGGIDRVDFWCEGNTVTVTQPELITQYNGKPFEGYKIILDASRFPASDGPLEIYATVVPSDGTAQNRVISLLLYGNTNGTLTAQTVYADSVNGDDSTGDGSSGNPYASITECNSHLQGSGGIDGGTIALRNGNYDYSEALAGESLNDRWLTIKSDEGHAATIDSRSTNDGQKTRKIKLQDLSFTVSISSKTLTGTTSIWIDNCIYTGSGQETTGAPLSGTSVWNERFWTESTVSDIQNGMVSAALIRNGTMERLGSDAISASDCVINAVVDDLNRGSQTSWHPDVWASSGAGSDNINVILYAIKAINLTGTQGFFIKNNSPGDVNEDVAIVNCLMEGAQNQIHDSAMSHFFFAGNTLTGGGNFNLRDDLAAGIVYEYLECVGNVLEDRSSTVASADHGINDNKWDYNFYEEAGDVHGTNTSTGIPQWNASYIPTADGNLKMGTGRFTTLDLNGVMRSPSAAYFGAYEA